MRQKALTVSIIIPVYNEEDCIFDCLNAVTNQTIKPLEIIIVDNNSHDQTVAIARRFNNVKIINEHKQGLIMARNTGFSEAKGDILARIDADALIPRDWIEKVQNAFMLNSSLDGITGYGRNRVGIDAPLLSDFFSWAYFTHSKAYFGVEVLWGSNMAIRKKLWQKIQPLCYTDDSMVHEDQDLSLAAASMGALVKVDPSLCVSVDYGDIQYFGKFWLYYKKQRSTRLNDRLHYRYNYRSRHTIAVPKRLMYELITFYSVPIYFAATIIKSLIRFSKSRFLDSSVYWWYQKIKSDI